MKTLLLVLAGTGLLMLAVLANRVPTVFTDTDDYYSQGVELWQKIGIDRLHLTEAEPDLRTPEEKVQARDDEQMARTQMAARSTSYSIFLYGLESAGTLWLVTAAQAAAAAWLLRLTLRSAAPAASGWAYLALMAGLAAGSTLPFFAGFAMPDIFAGVALLGCALLLLDWHALSRAERAGVLVILWFALVVHTSHELLAITLLPVGAVLLWWLGVPRRAAAIRLVVIAATVLAAIGWNTSYGMIVESQTGERLRHQPFLMARTLADGPGRRYLRQACAAGETYALCAFAKLPLDDSEDILWSDSPTTGVFLQSDWATRVQLELDEPRFVLGVLAHEPWGQFRASFANFAKQLTLFRLDDPVKDPHYYMTDDYWAHTYLPDLIMGVAHCGRKGNACPSRMTPALSTWWHGSVVIAALLVLGGTFATRRLPRPVIALALLVLAGVVLNAAITGVLSGPFARYQSRLIWLVPALAGVVVAASRRLPATVVGRSPEIA